MDFITHNIALVIGVLIIVIGLLVVGLRDVLRFSPYRVWAISGVSFDESIRKKILWVTPMAIIGVILVSQLTRPFDELDAIGQTVKFSIFATGLVVAMASIILAATNLPKEIENRVIYTIVTKPTTRLEIVIGKVIGFARVSAAILLIMGLFTWGYLHFRSWSLQRDITQSLKDDQLTVAERAALEHYRDFGLLTAKKFATPVDLQVFSRPPEGELRWVPGGGEGSVLFPFFYSSEDYNLPSSAPTNDPMGMVLMLDVGYDQSKTIMPDDDPLAAYQIPMPSSGANASQRVPLIPTPLLPPRPRVMVTFLDAERHNLVMPNEIDPDGRGYTLPRSETKQPLTISIPPEAAEKLVKAGRFFIQLTMPSRGSELSIRPPSDDYSPVMIRMIGMQSGQIKDLPPQSPTNTNMPTVIFRGRDGTFGQQIRGDATKPAVAVLAFRDANIDVNPGEKVSFEMRVGIERSGDEQSLDSDDFTNIELQVMDPKTGLLGQPVRIAAESNRNVYFNLPSDMIASGNFDLVVRNLTPGHWVSLLPGSVQLITGNTPFAWNLAKSLLVLWLMSVLVVVVAVFCSTFLSWPIAIVLTIVILLGNWGVQQIGETGSEFGNQVAQQMFGNDGHAAQYRVVSESVNALNKSLQIVAKVLPDISQFAAGDELERGVSVPWQRLWDAVVVAFGFGVPLTVLAYVFLKNKEVAP